MKTKPVTLDSLAKKLAQLQVYQLPEVDNFIDFLLFKSPPPKRKRKRNNLHPAFGMWAEQLEGKDTAEYSLELRNLAAKRAHEREINQHKDHVD